MAEFATAERTAKNRMERVNRTNIPTAMKERIERTSGVSLDDVSVHYHSDRPGLVGALAYTQGNQVYLGAGQERHLPHELGHVVQQKMGMVRPTRYENGYAINDDGRLERQADEIGKGNVSFRGVSGKKQVGWLVQMATATLTEIRTDMRRDIQETVEAVTGESAGDEAVGAYSFTCQPIDAAFGSFDSYSYIKVAQVISMIGTKIRERHSKVGEYRQEQQRNYDFIADKEGEIKKISAIIRKQYSDRQGIIDKKKNELTKKHSIRDYNKINRLNEEIDNMKRKIDKNKGTRDGFFRQIKDFRIIISGIKLQMLQIYKEINNLKRIRDVLLISKKINIWESEDKKCIEDVKGVVSGGIHTRNQYHCAEPHALAKIMPKYQEKRLHFLQGKKLAIEQEKEVSTEDVRKERVIEIQAYVERIAVVENASYSHVEEKRALTEFLSRLKFTEVKHEESVIKPCPVCEQWVKGGYGWSGIKDGLI